MATKTIGIKFPIQDDVITNRLFQLDSTQRESLKSQLYFLLLTPIGSRWYLPEFGSNLKKYIFEPNDTITNKDIIQDLNTSVSKYIPNLSVANIDTKIGDSEYQVILTVYYIYQEGTYREADSLVIEFNATR